MKHKALVGLSAILMVLTWTLAGCPSIQLGGNSILGSWRVVTRFEGYEQAGTGILNFYANGTCTTNTLDGNMVSGTWRAQADGDIVADFGTSSYVAEGLLRQDFIIIVQVDGDELTGTIWGMACLELNCVEGNGTVEGVRISKAEVLSNDEAVCLPGDVVSLLKSMVSAMSL